MKNLFSKAYDWSIDWIKSKYSIWALFVLVFIDSSFFPFPTTLIFITISLLYPPRANYNAIIATLAMSSGGILGYCIGHFLWITPGDGYTAVARFFFDHIPGFDTHQYLYIRELYNRWSYGILFTATILPIPYQIYSISAGAFEINVFIFALSTLLFQGIRFFGLAYLIMKFGEGVKEILYKNLKIISVSVLTLLVIYVFALLIIKNR